MTQDMNIVIDRLKSIQKTSSKGTPYWIARELMEALDYREWRDFREVVERAITSCEMAGNLSTNHFVLMPEMIVIGKGGKRERENFALSKYACYLVAMNGDPNKPEIAKAQAYFADQTYKQEQQESLTEEQRRAVLRDRVKDANKKLGGAAKDAGEVGKEVRKTIEIIGGTMPEHLPAAPSIKRIKPAKTKALNEG